MAKTKKEMAVEKEVALANSDKAARFQELMRRLKPGGIEKMPKEDRIANIESSIAKYKDRVKKLEAKLKELKSEK